jgi:phosphohistidine phosphatase
MKTLFICRHAKSSWKNKELEDFERPLMKKGIKKSKEKAEIIKNEKIDLIISSYAKRAFETAKIIAAKLNYLEEDIEIDKALIEGDENEILNMIKNTISDSQNFVMIFGHNPTLSLLAENLVGFEEDISTSGIVCIEFNVDRWGEISKDNAKFKFYL